MKISLLANEYYHDIAKQKMTKKAELPPDIYNKHKNNPVSRKSSNNRSPVSINALNES